MILTASKTNLPLEPVPRQYSRRNLISSDPIIELLEDTDDATIDFVSGIDRHNFVQTGSRIGGNEFLIGVANFISSCREGEAEFRGPSFHQFLDADLLQIYEDNQNLYKEEAKYQRRFDLVRDYLPLRGKLLDWGTGDAGFAKFVQDKTKLRVAGCDVIDWRSEGNKCIPFYRLDPYLSSLSKCRDEEFDTVILMYVLHHIDPENLEQVLGEVMRVCKRNVIVVEDTFGVEKADTRDLCRLSKRFADLPHSSQLQIIKMRDYFRNIVVLQVEDMNMPFEFKPIDEWHRVFSKEGLKVADTKVVGFNSMNSWSNTSFNVVFNLKK